MAGYDKQLGERNFSALNEALKDLIVKREEDRVLINNLKSELMRFRVQLDTMNQTLNVYKAMSMGNGATV